MRDDALDEVGGVPFSGASVTGFCKPIGEQVAGVHPPLVGLEEEVDMRACGLAAGGQVSFREPR